VTPARTAILFEELREIGKNVIAPAADDVDRRARFPHEGIDALKRLKLLGGYLPVERGGLGLDVVHIAQISELLGHFCASTAMVFAMHQIQVACILHHGAGSRYFDEFLDAQGERQSLVASATTEAGVGGDLRSSLCAVDVTGDRFTLVKKAPVLSYGEASDYILATARRGPDAGAGDQVMVLLTREDCRLEPLSTWDTLGFRGTCSPGFAVTAAGAVAQILPAPFAEILSDTMHPFAHIVWSSLWSGIAASAVNKARAFVRAEARKSPSLPPTSALRLGEADTALQTMRAGIDAVATEYQNLLQARDRDGLRSYGFAIRVNNLKLASSQQVVDIVGRAMLICGIAAYRNDSDITLGRHLRDAYGAALMVNNDRIATHNATLLLTHKEG